jgi:hypothetical protein
MPNPVPGKPFPVPHEGSDESDGVVLYEAHIPQIGGHHWIGVAVDDVNGQGWIVAGLDSKKPVVSKASTFCQSFLFFLRGSEVLTLPLSVAFGNLIVICSF